MRWTLLANLFWFSVLGLAEAQEPAIDRHLRFRFSETAYQIGNHAPIVVIPPTLLAYALPGGQRMKALVLAQSLYLSHIASSMLKFAAQRERPDGSNNFSFPSAHASNSFAWASFLSTDLSRRLGEDGGWLRTLAVSAPYMLASYVAASRVGGERHYMTDIVAGAALGTAIGYGLYHLHFDRRGRERKLPVTVVPELDPRLERVGLWVSAAF